MRRNDVKTIVVIGNGGKFSGGFDINVLQEVQHTGNLLHLGRVSVDLMINTIEEAKKPSVAAIQGLALGGGLELAMSCHARISTPKVQLGFPELQFAIIPGFGGNLSHLGRVSVDLMINTIEGVVQGILAMKCRIPDDDVGEGSDMTLKLTEIGMRLEDMEGAHVNGRNSLLILKRALSCHRTMNYNNFLASYQQFLKAQSELKDEKMKNENLIDTLRALGGITAFAIICFLIL